MEYLLYYFIFCLCVGVWWAWRNRKSCYIILMFLVGTLAAPLLLFGLLVTQIDNWIDDINKYINNN